MKHTLKCRAKVISAVCPDGDLYHYVLIGGRWRYNGRKSLRLGYSSLDGFWFDSMSKILCQSVATYTLKELFKIMRDKGATNLRLAIREWEVK